MLINRKRIIAATAAAAIAFGTASFSTPASAGSRGDAVAVAAILGVFGTIAAIAAADAARDRYHGPYYGAPDYYGPQAYYGPAPYAGAYRGPNSGHWRRHHWHH